MNATARPNQRFASALALRLVHAVSICVVPAGALAQANACDQLKTTLAARIEASGVRGYSLEVVPASTPVPAGAKAIGNCEGGERKVLYRRWGGASAAAGAQAAAAPASAAAPSVAPEPPVKRLPVRPNPPAPVVSAAVVTPAPAVKVEAAKPPPSRASEVDVVRAAEPATSPAARARPSEPLAEKPSLSQQVSEFAATHWRWLLALLLVPLAALGWAWRAHHLAFDKNGLPRGPRLRA
jgi:Protein of unknown function (DUF1161)